MSNGRELFGLTKQEIQADADADTRRKSGKRKNTKAWCKGKKGREHQPEIVIPANSFWGSIGYTCGWDTQKIFSSDILDFGDMTRYKCTHAEVCTVCGKILRHPPFVWGNDGNYSISVTECPNYTPEPSTA